MSNTPRTDAAVLRWQRHKYYLMPNDAPPLNAERLLLPEDAELMEVNANKLQIAYDEAEEALREIHMLCGNPDPADGDGTTPQEVKESVEFLKCENQQLLGKLSDEEFTRTKITKEYHDLAVKNKQELDELLSAFKHVHVSNGVDDACKQCGLDFRNEIHQRL